MYQLTTNHINDKNVLRIDNLHLSFTVKEIVNPDDHDFCSTLFVISGYYGVDAMVWANNLNDALDTIVDADESIENTSDKRFNQYLIDEIDLADYDLENYPPDRLGNYCEYYNLDHISVFEITNSDLISGILAYAQAMGLMTEQD